jgi:hypothetical protein
MKYFLHDTSAFEDEKIIELYKNYGYEGVGLFNVFLEKIGKQEKPIKTDILKFQLNIGKRLEKCWSFMEGIGLICSTDGESFNNNLLNFSESYKIKKEKTREKVSQWREKQKNIKTVTSYETVSNHSKVKESKVNKNKETINKEQEIINEFLELFKKITGKLRIRVVDEKTKKQLIELLKSYSMQDIEIAIKNACNDQYHKESKLKYITPEFITRADKFQKFVSMDDNLNIKQPTKQMLPR